MNALEKAKYIVTHLMYDKDAFSQWMGIVIEDISLGSCQLSMIIQAEMLNGFRISHGGIAYALADSALAFAANTYGYHAVTLETSISHVKVVHEGDKLRAVAKELSRSARFGIYEVTITNQKNQTIAIIKGTMYVKDTEWVL